MLLRVTLIYGLGLVSLGWAQGSAENLARAQEGLGEQPRSKKSDNQTSAFAGKMFASKEVQIKEYTGRQSEIGQRAYANPKNSDYDQRRQQVMSESIYSVERNKFSESKRSNLDGVMHAGGEDDQASALQKKGEISMHVLASKEGPDWVTRRSPQYHQKNSEVRMYEGRLTRVREKVSREEDFNRRDLGVGRQEVFNPEEVQKILKPQNIPDGIQPISPLNEEVKAESESAFLPVVVDSSLDSP